LAVRAAASLAGGSIDGLSGTDRGSGGTVAAAAAAVATTPESMRAKTHQPRKEASVYGVIQMKDQL
jgi:hypothetical protein